MSIIRRSYDQGYFKNLLHQSAAESHRNRQRLRVVLEHKQNGRLLEIGPGTGGFMTLASRHFLVEGVEVSPHALDHITPELRHRIRIGSIEDMPLAQNGYEVVAAFNVLEHLRNPSAVVGKIKGALVPGGCLVGSVPCNMGIVGRSYTRLGNFFDKTHCSTYEPERWREAFEQAGFSAVDFFGEMPVGPNNGLHIRGSHWRHISPNLMFVCS